MKITNPVLNELYQRVCKELEAKNKTQSEVRTELTKKEKVKNLEEMKSIQIQLRQFPRGLK
jgi:hypothetical protein